MPVVAVVNRKGGSGKSTLATHLAGCLARRGASVMLGDVDRQQSTVPWLKRRAAEQPGGAPIVGWVVDAQRVMRPPAGVSQVVLDTPGGLHGFELARVLMAAEAVLIPVPDSAFDRDSAAACWAELKAHPRVSGARCRVAAVGMRIDGRTSAAQRLAEWADDIGLPLVGTLRATQTYVNCAERGLTIFDLPPARVQADLDEWQPLLDWLAPVWEGVAEAAAEARTAPMPLHPVQRPIDRAPRERPLPPPCTSLEPAALAAPPTLGELRAPPPSWLRRVFGGWLQRAA